MTANDRQVGGSHYKGVDYEYWDYAEDAKLGYLAGHAGKYPYRHKGKDGLKDLQKAIHFIDKCEEKSCLGAQNPHWRDLLDRLMQSNIKTMTLEAEVLFYIAKGEWPRARTCVEALLSEVS